MKTPQEFINQYHYLDTATLLEEYASQFKKDTYNKAIQDAADSAKTSSYWNEIYDEWMTVVDQESILKLKK